MDNKIILDEPEEFEEIFGECARCGCELTESNIYPKSKRPLCKSCAREIIQKKKEDQSKENSKSPASSQSFLEKIKNPKMIGIISASVAVVVIAIVLICLLAAPLTMDKAKKNLESNGYTDFSGMLGSMIYELGIDCEDFAVFAKGDFYAMSYTDEMPKMVMLFEFKDKDTAKEEYNEVQDANDEYYYELSGKIIIISTTRNGIDHAKKKK